MPPRSELLTKRWSTFDLPILPFLAPRVFKPWPQRGRKVHSGTAARTNTNSGARNHDDWSNSTIKEVEKCGEPISCRGSVNEKLLESRGLPSIGGKCEEPGKLEEFEMNNDFDSANTSKTASTLEKFRLLEEEEFKRKYEEIWGARAKKRSLESGPVRKVEAWKGKEICTTKPASETTTRESPSKPTEGKPRSKTANKMPRPEFTVRRSPSKLVRKQMSRITISRSGSSTRHSKKGLSETRSTSRVQASMFHERNPKSDLKTPSSIRLRGPNEATWLKSMGDSGARVKWVLIYPKNTDVSSAATNWHRSFALLNLRQRDFERDQPRPRFPEYPRHGISEAHKIYLIELDSSESLRKEWEKLPENLRAVVWQELMITALEHHSSKALKFLVATYCKPFPIPTAITDSLDYIISRYLEDQNSLRPSFALHLKSTYLSLLHQRPANYLFLSQRSIHLLLSNLEDGHVKSLYENLVEVEHPLHQNTLMHFASYLAKSGETDLGFKILEKLGLGECDFNSPKMMSLCTTLLQRSNRGLNASSSDSEMFEFMLARGMKPNIITYNTLLQNALQAGDSETSWQIHELMIENGIQPDGYTYSILLNDAKLRMDTAAIKTVMHHVREKGIRSAHIINDVLHAILLLHRHEERNSQAPPGPEERLPASAFERMLPVYREYFHIAPLARIIPCFTEKYPDTSNSGSSLTTKGLLIDVPGPALTVMITGYLNGATSQTAKEFYDHFSHLVFDRDPAVADLMGFTKIWNLLLMTLGNFHDRLVDCPKVVFSMFAAARRVRDSNSGHLSSPKVIPDHNHEQGLQQGFYNHSHLKDSEVLTEKKFSDRDQLKTSIDEDISFSRPSQSSASRATISIEKNSQMAGPAVPDIYTWSILLQIFVKHGQPRAAEKVLSAMQLRGVTPNHITWNSLTFCYGLAQDTVMTVDTIHRMEQAGFQSDEVTMKGLSKIRDRRALIEAIKRTEMPAPPEGVFPMGPGVVKAVTRELKKDMAEEEDHIESKLREEGLVVRDLKNSLAETKKICEGQLQVDMPVVGDMPDLLV